MELLEGKPIANRLTEEVKTEIETLKTKTGANPKLVTVHIGDDSASEWYNKSIKKGCEKVGIDYELFRHPDINIEEAKALISKLNSDNNIHGILINQPLPKGFHPIVEMIDPLKDIEGVTAQSLGRLLLNEETHIPCTPLAVMTILDEYNIALNGVKVCLIGRSNIVGKPLSILLTQRNATVTLCHSKTKDLENEIKMADMVIAAIGKPKYVKKEWVREGTIVIDVGTNYSESGLVGDVDFDGVKEKASKITPVPGGVGGLTNIILLKNCVEAFMRQKQVSI